MPPAEDKLEALRSILRDAARKDTKVKTEHAVAQNGGQGNNQGNNWETMAPIEAKQMPVPIYSNEKCINKPDSRTIEQGSHDTGIFTDEGQVSSEKGSLERGTVGSVGKASLKKESRIEGKPGPALPPLLLPLQYRIRPVLTLGQCLRAIEGREPRYFSLQVATGRTSGCLPFHAYDRIGQ